MAISKTTYLELNKPDYDAIADIEVLNDNADILSEERRRTDSSCRRLLEEDDRTSS